MANPVYIYLLADPVTREPKYVGSAENVRQRLRQHLAEGRSRGRQKDEWMASLDARNLVPSVSILETVTEAERRDREDHWRATYLHGGAPLVEPSLVERNGAVGLAECPRCRKLLRALRKAVTTLTTDEGKAVGNRPLKNPNHWTRRAKSEDLLTD
jgi:predicted GIY-YIG superfamily endonuclease